MPAAPSPSGFRRYAYKHLLAVGIDWREKLPGWWFILLRLPDGESRPVLITPACWLITAARYAQIDAGCHGEVEYVSTANADAIHYVTLLNRLARQVEIDAALRAISTASA